MRIRPRGACRSWKRRAFGVPVSLFAYIVCAARKSTARVVFFAPRREKPNACYLQRTPLPVVCNGFSTLLRAAHLLQKNARRFSRETGRRDLRRPSGHPASLRLPAQSGTRGPLTTHPDAALSNPQRRKFLSPFCSLAAAES